jgi:hypothetical protein
MHSARTAALLCVAGALAGCGGGSAASTGKGPGGRDGGSPAGSGGRTSGAAGDPVSGGGGGGGSAGPGGAGGAGAGICGGASGGPSGNLPCACEGFVTPNPAGTGLPNPAAYSDNADGTVTDQVTGLVWQGAVDPGVYTQEQAATYCASKAPTGSWRVPTRLELVSLVDYAIASPGPAIDQTHFPNTPTAMVFWTSSAYVGTSGFAWTVAFSDGATYGIDATDTSRVRCVLASPTCYRPRYQAQTGGLVMDSATGLTWQQTVDGSSYSFDDAASHCAGLGASWRVPSLTELQTIVDDTQVNPAIDGTAFPNTPGGFYWTSTAYAGTPGLAWFVSFVYGNTYNDDVNDTNNVRCVR